MPSGGSATSGHSAITFTSGKRSIDGKGGARIDDGHVVAEQLGDRRERLADMHGAGDDELRRRNVDGEEDPAPGRFLHSALAAANPFLDQVFERVARDVGRLDQPLLAAGDIGDHDRGAPRRAFGVQCAKDVDFHGCSLQVASGE